MSGLLKRLSQLLILLTLICLPFSAQAAQSLNTEILLKALELKYSNQGFSAEFTQTARLAALDMTEKATGRAWFSHPGKMKWLYLTPDRHEIITDGNQLWIYRPDENQVMVGQAASFFKPGTGGAFLSDITQIRESFRVESGRMDEKFAELILTPKQENPDLSRAVITMALPSHEIQMVVTQNIYKDTTRFVLTHINFHDPDPEIFHFAIPDGTSIIEMN